MTDLNHIGIIGFGAMGAGIAHVLAASGRIVTVIDADPDRPASGLADLEALLQRRVDRGTTTSDDKDALLGRLTVVTDLSALASVDVVIEAIAENLDAKKALLLEVAGIVGLDVPLLTNTSALSVTTLAAALPNPTRVAGLHFFNPAPVMATVEVVRAEQTDEALIDRLVNFTKSLEGKVPVVVDDRPGFLLNALLMPYLNDVLQAYDDELATAEDLDLAIELGLGYKTGPMTMLDMIGLDVYLSATENLYAATRDPRYAPPPLLRRMVAAGQVGLKSGEGLRAGKDGTSS